MRIITYFVGLLVFTGFIYVFQFMKDIKRIEVDRTTGISGKITGVNRARGYKIYLNGSNQPYSFDDFFNRAIAGNDGLGYFIELKDSVEKKPNSDTLCLTRGRVKTYWLFEKNP